MHSQSLRRADLVGVAVTLLLLTTLVFGQVTDSRELANRSTCAANIRGIMQSLVVYASDNSDIFPALPMPASATTYDVTCKGLAFPGNNAEQAIVGMNKEDSLRNNPSAAIWMLVVYGQVSTKQFVCKSDPFAVPAPMMNQKQEWYINFPAANTFSYSTAYSWTEKNGKVVVADLWKNTMDAGVPIVTDMAPYLGRTAADFKDPAPVNPTPEGRAQTERLVRDLSSPDFATRETATKELASKGSDAFPGLAEAVAASTDPELRARASRYIGSSSRTQQWVVTKSNSANHFFDGQNVAFGDAHAEFSRTPAVGENNESIWGMIKDPNNGPLEIPIAAGTLLHPLTGTQGDFDTVMVPTRDAKGNLK